jgi:hypothetical protein
MLFSRGRGGVLFSLNVHCENGSQSKSKIVKKVFSVQVCRLLFDSTERRKMAWGGPELILK